MDVVTPLVGVFAVLDVVRPPVTLNVAYGDISYISTLVTRDRKRERRLGKWGRMKMECKRGGYRNHCSCRPFLPATRYTLVDYGDYHGRL